MKVFKEEQRFTQLWLILLLALSVIVPIGLICQDYFKENSTISTNSFIISIVLIMASVSIIFLFKLKTRIDEIGIHYQFFPFHFSLKTYHWSQIAKAYVRNYDPIGEYGGWGLKGGAFWNSGKGKAINVSGDIGIQLELKDGNRILIGTQKKEEAKKVLETYKNKII